MSLSLALAALLAASAQVEPLQYDPEARLSLIVSAERLPVILEQVNQQTGAKLFVNPQFENEVFAIRVKDRRLGDLMDAIAAATDGEWLASGRLTSDSIAPVRREKARQERVQRSLQKMIAEAAETYKKDGGVSAEKFQKRINAPKAPDDKPDWNDYMRNNLGAQLGLEIAPHLPVSRISALKSGERLVLSSAPTAMQVPMPGPMIQTIRKAFGEIAKINPSDIETENGPGQDYALHELKRQASLLRRRPIVNVLLVIQIQTYGPSVMPMMALHGLDATGRSVFETNVQLPNSMTDEMQDWEKMQQQNSAELEKNKPLAISEEARRFAQMITQNMGFGFMGGESRRPIDLDKEPRLLELLLNPDRYEPVKFGFGQLLGEALERTESEGVLLLDDLFGVMMGEGMPPMGPRQLLMLLERFGMMSERKGIKVMEASMESPRVNRKALAVATQRIRKERVFTWENAITYARSISGEPSAFGAMSSFDMMYLSAASGMGEVVMEVMQSMPFLRWVGQLPQPALDGLLAGRPVQVRTLVPAQQEGLLRFVLRGGLPLRNEAADAAQVDEEIKALEAGQGLETFSYGEGSIEPTQILAGGLSRDTLLTLERKNAQVVLLGRNDQGKTVVVEPEMLGMMQKMADRPGAESEYYDRYKGLVSFQIGGKEYYNFTIRFDKHIVGTVSIPFYTFDFRTSFKLNELPSEIQKQIKQGQDIDFGEEGGAGPSQTPPPLTSR